MNKVHKMNDGNPQGDGFRRTTPWATMNRDSQGEKLDMTASVPCQGCLNGYGCYNERQCSNFSTSYPPSPTPYMQPMMPYSSMAEPAPYGQMMPPVNHHPYHGYAAPPPPQHQQFMGHQPHSAQPFYYGQSHAYNGPYYHHPSMKAAPHRYKGPPRRNSKGYRSNDEHINGAYEESLSSLDMGSDNSSLTFCGIFSEDVRRAVSFVKRNRSATLFQIEGKNSDSDGC